MGEKKEKKKKKRILTLIILFNGSLFENTKLPFLKIVQKKKQQQQPHKVFLECGKRLCVLYTYANNTLKKRAEDQRSFTLCWLPSSVTYEVTSWGTFSFTPFRIDKLNVTQCWK